MAAAIWVHRFYIDNIGPGSAFDGPAPVRLPVDAKLVHAEAQGPALAMWFTNPDVRSEQTVARWFQIVGTGHTLPIDADYVGTGLFGGGSLMLHLLEVPAP